jgi:ABC-type spermidine/putrescine transport system permease subunit II
MWDEIRIAINPTISAVSSLLIVLSIVLLLVLQLVRSRTK